MEQSIVAHGKNETYSESAMILVDVEAFNFLDRLRFNGNKALSINRLNFDIPEVGDKTHELYIVLDDLIEQIAQYKDDMEDYYRPTGINTNKVVKEYTPESILVDILQNQIKQVVFRFTNAGFDKQDAYSAEITTAISQSIITVLSNTIMTDSTLSQDPARIQKSMIKIASSVAMRVRDLIVTSLGEILAVNQHNYGFYPVDNCVCDLNGKVMGTVLNISHMLYGFNQTRANLARSIANWMIDNVSQCDTGSRMMKFINAEMSNLLLDNIDSIYKKHEIAPPMSYYNIALLTFDKLKDLIMVACDSAVKCDECDVGTEYTHLNDLFDAVPDVTDDVIKTYIDDFYTYCESDLNAKCISIIQKEVESKLELVVGAGIVNKHDCRVHVYVDDDVTGDTYCKSYGFITFKQNVTPFQVGMVKCVMEEQMWDIFDSDFAPIELRINKLKTK